MQSLWRGYVDSHKIRINMNVLLFQDREGHDPVGELPSQFRHQHGVHEDPHEINQLILRRYVRSVSGRQLNVWWIKMMKEIAKSERETISVCYWFFVGVSIGLLLVSRTEHFSMRCSSDEDYIARAIWLSKASFWFWSRCEIPFFWLLCYFIPPQTYIETIHLPDDSNQT